MVHCCGIWVCSPHIGSSDKYRGISWILQMEPISVSSSLSMSTSMWNTSIWSVKYLVSNHYIWGICPGREQRAPPVVEDVHWGAYFHCSRVPEEAPALLIGPGRIPETPQVCWSALAKMSLPAIRESENPPQYWVAIHHTTVLNRHWDPRCLPALMKIMQPTICEPSTLLKFIVRCIFPQVSSVLPGHSQSIWDQECVQSHSISETMVFCRQVSILTTSWVSRAIQSLSTSVLHHFAVLVFSLDGMHRTLHSGVYCLFTMRFHYSNIL